MLALVSQNNIPMNIHNALELNGLFSLPPTTSNSGLVLEAKVAIKNATKIKSETTLVKNFSCLMMNFLNITKGNTSAKTVAPNTK